MIYYFADYAEGLTNNGFEILKYENCSQHAAYGYQILAPQAEELGSIEADGLSLSTHYQETSKCFQRGELGMIIIVARKKIKYISKLYITLTINVYIMWLVFF